jgi:hypothetical protein
MVKMMNREKTRRQSARQQILSECSDVNQLVVTVLHLHSTPATVVAGLDNLALMEAGRRATLFGHATH